jgi:hypothetical protein
MRVLRHCRVAVADTATRRRRQTVRAQPQLAAVKLLAALRVTECGLLQNLQEERHIVLITAVRTRVPL